MSVQETLRQLVAIDSVSSRTNQPVVRYLAERLQAAGFTHRPFTCTDEAGIEKTNLVAWKGGTAPEGGLALVGHTDTVPYDPSWSQALALTRIDGNWYGRGSADTKGGIAAMLCAIESLSEPLQKPLLFIGTADEEVGCKGAKRMVMDDAVHPDFAIIAEPTRLIPIRAHKGYCVDQVTVHGREGHSAYPAVGRSAIMDAARVLLAIETLAVDMQADANPEFDPPHTTLNVGTISGGKARNVIPGDCTFPLEWRPLPDQPLELVHERLAARIESLGDLQVTLSPTRRDPGASTSRSSPLVAFLEETLARPSETVAFGTELPYLTQLGAQAVVVGPGDIRVAHRTGEFIPDDELEAAVGLYRNAIRRFCC